MKLFFTACGLALVIEGMPYFLFPSGIKRLLASLQEMPAQSLRLFGLTAMLIGVAIMYLAKMS
ncbi:MAG: DUF2065 domain-containing protein [Deltaproteobacteria bacterium]|nr:DUF2065 domain-containing protein [Candidatus Anaeroferrophillus wilburensis]MBN2889857.1 DUF2065 domain-containing protein [Deltaproteobacteria bacterium]